MSTQILQGPKVDKHEEGPSVMLRSKHKSDDISNESAEKNDSEDRTNRVN